MKILLTGTHFTPATATIEELRKIDLSAEIVYIGRGATQEGDSTRSVESKELPAQGVKFIPIITGRLQRSFSLYTIPSLFKIPLGFLQALYIILREKPDVILSFGGYVAVPVVFAGWLFSVPIIIHEQGLVPGLANKISAMFADKVAVSFRESGFSGEKVVLTGNPVRAEIVKKSQGDNPVHFTGARRLPAVLIMGGNQGSHAINLAVEECLDKLLKIANVYHQTGDSKYRDYDRLSKLRIPGQRYRVKKWIGKEYGELIKETDLVVSRAGINTLTELAVSGIPALIVPIANREQTRNAEYFQNKGLVKVLPQSRLSGKAILKEISSMIKALDQYTKKASEAKKVIIPNGAKMLALETILLCKT